jgi:hypothetical protein
VAEAVGLKVLAFVTCGVLERAALFADREQGLGAVVLITTTWRSSKSFPGVAAMTGYRPGVKEGETFQVKLPLFGTFAI